MASEELKAKLRKQLGDLEDKAEWEGGLATLILDYGGYDLFPPSCRPMVEGMISNWQALRTELARLSDYCGGTRNAW